MGHESVFANKERIILGLKYLTCISSPADYIDPLLLMNFLQLSCFDVVQEATDG